MTNPYEAPQNGTANTAVPPVKLAQPNAATTLADLRIGQLATVTALAGTDSISARLLEMGLIPGTAVTLIGKAPLGDPLEFELRGYRLSLRKTEAQRVAINL